MPNRMETSMQRLQSRLLGRIGTTVTIRRGSILMTQDVPAVLGNQLLKVTHDDGTPQTVMTDKDFLIPADEYKFDDIVTEPKRGDKIDETINGKIVTYEVLPYGDEKEFRWADEFRQTLRIHTKRIV